MPIITLPTAILILISKGAIIIVFLFALFCYIFRDEPGAYVLVSGLSLIPYLWMFTFRKFTGPNLSPDEGLFSLENVDFAADFYCCFVWLPILLFGLMISLGKGQQNYGYVSNRSEEMARIRLEGTLGDLSANDEEEEEWWKQS